MADHLQTCLNSVPIFNHLDDASLAIISKKVYHKTISKGQSLFKAGDRTDALYVVHRGGLKVYRLLQNGREQVVQILGPGDFIGERHVFMEETVHDDYTQALVDSRICTIHKADLDQIMLDYPEISLKIIEIMSKRLNDSYKQTSQVGTEKVGQALAMFLLDLVDNDSESPVVKLPMSRKDLASYLGTRSETISRKFKELEEKGLITQKTRSDIQINNLDHLLYYTS